MTYLLTMTWVTQASDFITQNWLKFLGLIGGASSIIAILTAIVKIFLTLIQGKISKKSNLPLQQSFKDFQQKIDEILNKLIVSLTNMLELSEEHLRFALVEELEKAQKMKVALYDKLITEGENAQEILDGLNKKLEELKVKEEYNKMDNVEEDVDVNETLSSQLLTDSESNIEKSDTKSNVRKAKKVIVE